MDPSLALDAGNKFIDAGLLGAAVILLIFAVIWLVRQVLKFHADLLKEKDARLQDAKEYAEIVQANTTAMETLINTLSPQRRRG